MHRLIREHLENYLRGSGEPGALAGFRAHMASCESCREEVGAIEAQARLLRLLEVSEEIEPQAGLYARVMETIEARQSASIRYALSEPAFGYRLIFACLAAVILLGSYLLYMERGPAFGASSPVTIMAVGTPDRQDLGSDPQNDRETVLLALASYQE